MSNDGNVPNHSKTISNIVNISGGKRLGYSVSCTPTKAGRECSPDVIEITRTQVVPINQSCVTAPRCSQVRYIPIHISKSLLPKKDKTAHEILLCRHCGVQSYNPSLCSSCKKPMTADTQVKSESSTAKQNHSSKTHTSSINCNEYRNLKSRYFYNNQNLADFTRYVTSTATSKRSLKVQRTRKNAKNPQECITIEDSSDDETPEISSTSSSEQASPAVSPTAMTGQVYARKIPRIFYENSSPQKTHATGGLFYVSIDSARIGDMKTVPSTMLQISPVGMSMTLSEKIFKLNWSSVSRVELSPILLFPCLYITVKDECLGFFRSSLDLVPGRSPYYDPYGPEKQRYIIFHIAKNWFREHQPFLRAQIRQIMVDLKLPQTFYEEILASEARKRRTALESADARNSPLNSTSSESLSAVSASSGTHPTTTPTFTITTRRLYLTRAQSKPTSVVCSDVEEIKPSFNGPPLQLAIYPPPPSNGGISITTEDLFCLNDGEFLNDVIIDFYLKYTMQEILSAEERNKSHVFSSFFYKRLTDSLKGCNASPEEKTLSAAERRHKRVRKWTRNVDLFSKDFIFIPINDSSHWYLAVICFPGLDVETCEQPTLDLVVSNVRSLGDESAKPPGVADEDDFLPPLVIEDVRNNPIVIECHSNGHSNDVEMTEDTDPLEIEVSSSNKDTVAVTKSNGESTCGSCEKNRENPSGSKVNPSNDYYPYPCILIFDSLRTVSRSNTAAKLREYLTEEWRQRKASEFGEKNFDTVNMKMCTPSVPQQDNYSDCGVFVLHYVEMMFHKPVRNFSLPIRSLQDWFEPAEAKQKRSIIKDVIMNLQKLQSS